MKNNTRRLTATITSGIVALILMISASTFGGAVQLNDRMLIQGIGVDQTEEGVKVSVQASQAEEEGNIAFQQTEGRTLLEALDKLVQKSGKIPLYSHNTTIVLGKECGEKGVEGIMDFFIRYYETRPSVSVFLAEGKAEDILGLQKDGKYVEAKNLTRISQSGFANGWIPNVRVIDFVNQLKGEGSSPYMPVLSVQEGEVEAIGTALFRQDQYCGMLTPEESRVLLVLTKGLSGGQIVAEFPETGKVTFTIRQVNGAVYPEIQNDQPHLSIQTEGVVEISAMDTMSPMEDWDHREEFLEKIENSISQELTGQIQQVLEKTLQDWHTDPFGIGRTLMQRETAWWKKNSQNWEEEMSQTKLQVSSQLIVLRVEQEVAP